MCFANIFLDFDESSRAVFGFGVPPRGPTPDGLGAKVAQKAQALARGAVRERASVGGRVRLIDGAALRVAREVARQQRRSLRTRRRTSR